MKCCLRFAIIFLLVTTTAAAQTNPKLDSLRQRLKVITQDTDRVNTLNRIAEYSTDSVEVNDLTSQALTIARKTAFTKGEANSNLVLGTFYFRKQIDFVRSARYYNECLRLRTTLNDEKGMAQCYLQLAIIDGKFENYRKARGLLCKAEELNRHVNNQSGLKSDIQAIAEMYQEESRFDSALYYFRLSATIGKETTISAAIRDINLVSIFLGLNELDSAELYIHKTDSIYDVLGNTYGKLWDKMQLGQIKLSRGNVKEALTLLELVYDTAEKTKNGDLLFNVLPPLIDAYRKSGDAVNGFRVQTEWIALKDSIRAVDKANVILGEQIKFEQDEKDKIEAIEQQHREEEAAAEKKKQEIIMWFVAGGAFIVLCFALFIFRSYRQKKKANAIISRQKEEVELQKNIIEEKQKEIIDSIQYAKRIQQSLLPTEKYISSKLDSKN